MLSWVSIAGSIWDAFSLRGPCLRLHEVVKFLGYGTVREIDEQSKKGSAFDSKTLLVLARPFHQGNPRQASSFTPEVVLHTKAVTVDRLGSVAQGQKRD